MEKEYCSDFLVDFGDDDKILIPVVVQDFKTKEVLILAFSNKEAFEESVRSSFATFWSRSRNKLWKKGETSGDFLKLKEIRVNCEQNSLLYLVEPLGEGSCHAKREDGKAFSGCFYRKLTDNRLEFI